MAQWIICGTMPAFRMPYLHPSAFQLIPVDTMTTPELASLTPVTRQLEAWDRVEVRRGQTLDRIFRDAGFDWREPGCSMCLAMNPDKLIGDQLSSIAGGSGGGLGPGEAGGLEAQVQAVPLGVGTATPGSPPG